MHKICLAHFERDLAAGGNMYSKFARCYLQLAGKEPSQLKKEPLHAAAAAAAAADTGQGHQVCPHNSHALLNRCMISPFGAECPQ